MIYGETLVTHFGVHVERLTSEHFNTAWKYEFMNIKCSKCSMFWGLLQVVVLNRPKESSKAFSFVNLSLKVRLKLFQTFLDCLMFSRFHFYYYREDVCLQTMLCYSNCQDPFVSTAKYPFVDTLTATDDVTNTFAIPFPLISFDRHLIEIQGHFVKDLHLYWQNTHFFIFYLIFSFI